MESLWNMVWHFVMYRCGNISLKNEISVHGQTEKPDGGLDRFCPTTKRQMAPLQHIIDTFIVNIWLVTTITTKWTRFETDLQKGDQPSRMIQSNHSRFQNRLPLARTYTAVYNMIQDTHHYPSLLPTYNHTNPQHQKYPIYLWIRI